MRSVAQSLQVQPALNNTMEMLAAVTDISQICLSDMYSLTLTDGTVVQLRVQAEGAGVRAPELASDAWSTSSSCCFSGDDSAGVPSSSASTVSVSSTMSESVVSSVSLEELRSRLSLPDTTTDLGALLAAAGVDLGVEDVVRPTLIQLKKTMAAMRLEDWQQALCIKIRRRKKNTAAVRSSRRKRSQYVQTLRQEVGEVRRRKGEAELANALLNKLVVLWEIVCSEVEAEVHQGVRQQLGIDVVMPAPTTQVDTKDQAQFSLVNNTPVYVEAIPFALPTTKLDYDMDHTTTPTKLDLDTSPYGMDQTTTPIKLDVDMDQVATLIKMDLDMPTFGMATPTFSMATPTDMDVNSGGL